MNNYKGYWTCILNLLLAFFETVASELTACTCPKADSQCVMDRQPLVSTFFSYKFINASKKKRPSRVS